MCLVSLSRFQRPECDIVKAYRDAALCRNTILKQHEDIKFSTIWEKATIIGDSIGIELTKIRTASNSRFEVMLVVTIVGAP